ncbi:hypothetical protein CCB80_08380 [Armatimonadetes bacterium Uphvl-Ar1]|nr:hypothetical protein CCB80_08380 [Armatimonadetes bacterium Uphvl-Ar1]
MLNGVHPWLFGLAILAVVSFIAIAGWTFKTKRSPKILPVLFLLILTTLVIGYLTADSASKRDTQRYLHNNIELANLIAISTQNENHAQIRLDGSSTNAIQNIESSYAEMFKRRSSITGIQTIRKTPDGKFQPITRSGDNKTANEVIENPSTFAKSWEGSGQILLLDDKDSASVAAVPVTNSAGKVEALLLATFSGDSYRSSQFDAQKGVITMTAILLLLTIFGGITGIQLIQTLAEARVARAELLLQGDRIREQMDTIAEKNQLMAASHDALAQANAKLQSLATLDGLTGVMNHRALMEFLSVHMKRNGVIGSPSSVILLDIDNFKQLNDQYGHMAGDEALRTIAQVLKQSCPKDAGVGRYGGEEFMMVLPGASESAAFAVAEELRRRIQMAKTSSRAVTASVGVSTVYSLSKSEQTLIDEADKAMYHSKQNGKNRVTHYGHGMLESA